MKLADRMFRIKESPTLAITAKAIKMQKSGLDVVSLSAGEPDFDTPDHIKEAAIKAIHAGKTKYTPSGGTIELKDAVVNKFKRENNLDYSTNQVLVSNGGKQSIFNLLQAIIGDGDEVIIPAPYWVSYTDMSSICGGTPVCIECTYEDNYKISAEKLKKAITPKSKAIFLNSPSNPTGMVYTETELRSLADVLLEFPNIYIVTDDIYEHLIFRNEKFSNILNVEPSLYNRVIIINGLSKAYAMTGWRIGIAACGDAEIIKAMDIIQSQSTSNPCSISQAAAVAALNSGLDFITSWRKAYRERHDYVFERLCKIPGVKALRAQGAFYSFFDCTEAITKMHESGIITEKSDIALAEYLLDKFLVALVPGSAFGLGFHMRLSFATSMEQLTKALDRMEQAIKW